MTRSIYNNEYSLKIETDWDIAKGRSLSSYETAGTQTRKQIFDFRKTLDNMKTKI